MTTTITSVYETYQDAIATVRELQAANVPDEEISVISNQPGGQDSETTERIDNNMAETGAASGAAIGGTLGGATGLLAALGTFAIPGIGPVIGAGWLLATSVGAAVGASAGGVLGALIGAGVSKDQAHIYVENLRQGGTLVSARVSDDQTEEVRAIMARRKAIDTARNVRREETVVIVPPTP
ncbi:MAG: general stress protein [Alphaproteobacteria bacterium]|jgi:hypothetical protein|nr:general stress protein [Alphaproteobacteria bacterium]